MTQESRMQKPPSKGSVVPTIGKEGLSSLYFRNPETEKLYQLYTREFSELTTENIRFYFEAARKGINFFKAFLFEEIRRRDLRIGGVCQTRKLSVLGNEWEIIGDDQSLVEFARKQFAHINIEQVFSDIVEAQLQGMGVFQLFYDLDGSKWRLSNIALVPNYLVYFKDGVKFIDFNEVNMYTLRAQAASERPIIPLIDIATEFFFDFYSFDGNEENGLLNGLIDSIIWAYLFKGYGLKDWSVFLERFAIPSVIGKFDPLMSKADRDTLWRAIQEFGNLYRAMIPNTASIDAVSDSNKGTSGALYESYVQKFWNNEIAIRVIGQAMTTDTSEGGSYAKALAAEYVRDDFKRADRILISSVMTALLKKLIDINFPDVTQYPKFAFKADEQINYKLMKADLVVKLRQAGYETDQDEMSEMFGITLIRAPQTPPVDQLPMNPLFSEKPSKKRSRIEEFLLDLWETLQ